jgi:L-asparaginase
MTRSVTVSLLGMGGTISTVPQAGGARAGRTAGDLVDGLPVDARIRPRDVRTVSSRAVTPDDMWALAEAVREELASGVDGVVVSHGTDTIEETAYALALLVDTAAPVVLTGAMRGGHLPGADGPANLAAAVAAAADPRLAAYGPVVVFQDEIHVARLVTKAHSTRVAAFTSPAAGPVGFVAEGRVELLLGPPPVPDLLPSTAAPAARVELVWAATGAGDALVDAVAGQADGLVVAGTGAGHLAPPFTAAVVRAVEAGTPVVLASRCVDGPQLRNTYGGVGSETYLFEAGLLPAGILSPVKARLRLLFGLSADAAPGELFPTRRTHQ